MRKNEVVYLTDDQAQDLVERIEKRCRSRNFDYEMSISEAHAMAELLCATGVMVDDIICVNNMADNYAINAEIVKGDEVNNYEQEDLDDSLFSWEENGRKCYCVSWQAYMYKIYDWMNNEIYPNHFFECFDSAEEFLSEKLGDNYDTDRQEYYIKEVKNESV